MLGIGLFHAKHSDTPCTQWDWWRVRCVFAVFSLSFYDSHDITYCRHCYTHLFSFKDIKLETSFHTPTYYNGFLSHSYSRSCSSHSLLLFIRESGLCKSGTIETGLKWGEANEWTPPSTVRYSFTLCGGEPSLTIEGFPRSALHLIVFPGTRNILFDC